MHGCIDNDYKYFVNNHINAVAGVCFYRYKESHVKPYQLHEQGNVQNHKMPPQYMSLLMFCVAVKAN